MLGLYSSQIVDIVSDNHLEVEEVEGEVEEVEVGRWRGRGEAEEEVRGGGTPSLGGPWFFIHLFALHLKAGRDLHVLISKSVEFHRERTLCLNDIFDIFSHTCSVLSLLSPVSNVNFDTIYIGFLIEVTFHVSIKVK